MPTASPWTASRSRSSTPRCSRLKDAVWAVGRDRLRTAREVATLAGGGASEAALGAYCPCRSRSSPSTGSRSAAATRPASTCSSTATVSTSTAPDVGRRARPRGARPALHVAAACAPPTATSASSTRRRRRSASSATTPAPCASAIAGDDLLRRALADDGAEVTVLGHTRWASVGIISEPNAHPLNSEEGATSAGPYVVGALNGDVDNYAELKSTCGLQHPCRDHDRRQGHPDPREPAVAGGRRADRRLPDDGRRRSTARWPSAPRGRRPRRSCSSRCGARPGPLRRPGRGRLHRGQRAVRPRRGDRAATCAWTARRRPTGADGSPGQVVVLDRTGAGDLAGLAPPRLRRDRAAGRRRRARHGRDHHPRHRPRRRPRTSCSRRSPRRRSRSARPCGASSSSATACSPCGRPRTRCRRAVAAGSPTARSGGSSSIGQGTAAIAGQAVGRRASPSVRATSTCSCSRCPPPSSAASRLRDDMPDTLVVAISQSGTTTDTNRTVDLGRARGAAVIAIVNRRNSDLVDKADGVLYTSDGRDVEMAVPSTKAFYAQIAAGVSCWPRHRRRGRRRRPTDRVGRRSSTRSADLPEAMEQVLDRRAGTSPPRPQQLGPSRRYWAVVGNGPNRDRRRRDPDQAERALLQVDRLRRHRGQEAHRPLVRAADPRLRRRPRRGERRRRGQGGRDLPGPQGGADRDRHRGRGPVRAALATSSRCRRCTPILAFVLSAMAGHLFGYEAALAIDAQARPLREVRAAVEELVDLRPRSRDELLERLATGIAAPATVPRRPPGGATTATSRRARPCGSSSLLRYAIGELPLESYEVDTARSARRPRGRRPRRRAHRRHRRAHPAGRRHQAPGQDGHRRHLPLRGELARGAAGAEALAARRAAGPARLPALRTLAALDPAVASVDGFTRYAVERRRGGGRRRRSHVVDKGGVGRDLPSRTERDPRLRGTKHRAADEREVTVAGARDGRTIVIVPETKDNEVTGITLLHVEFARPPARRRPPGGARGLPRPSAALRDAVTETEPTFDDDVLGRRARRRPPGRAGARPRCALGVRAWASLGIGTDLVELDRFRLAPAAARPGWSTGCSPTANSPTRSARTTRPSASRRASRRRRRP